MKQLLNFEIQIYDIIKTSCTNSTNTPSPACDDLYKTRFIFADGETIFSPAHFCQKLKSRGLQGVSIARNGDQLALPESAFEFDKICFLETKFKSKQSIWTIKRVWQDTHWYVTYREISGVKKRFLQSLPKQSRYQTMYIRSEKCDTKSTKALRYYRLSRL